ncbi:hypothetical protein HK097_009802 [Rhizophlyctis rosea]|uniref:Uncharacterized protein n=1 Tax=Rhizophlyctis rosea TaxID=64517 RepID=A0AAD5S8E8_9FUNG|nr:hypothetical protein HK097_009802 [Rhizophlyctis rosea]
MQSLNARFPNRGTLVVAAIKRDIGLPIVRFRTGGTSVVSRTLEGAPTAVRRDTAPANAPNLAKPVNAADAPAKTAAKKATCPANVPSPAKTTPEIENSAGGSADWDIDSNPYASDPFATPPQTAIDPPASTPKKPYQDLLALAPPSTRFAVFLCRCGREWKSPKGKEGYWQKCLKCKHQCYPESFEWHGYNDTSVGMPKKRHNQKLCGRCQELGFSCVKEKNGWNEEGITKVSKLIANMSLVEDKGTTFRGGVSLVAEEEEEDNAAARSVRPGRSDLLVENTNVTVRPWIVEKANLNKGMLKEVVGTEIRLKVDVSQLLVQKPEEEPVYKSW